MMPKLNENQSKVLRFVVDFYVERGYPAIFMDIVRRFDMHYNTARMLAYRLEQIGYVDILREQAKERTQIRGVFPLWRE